MAYNYHLVYFNDKNRVTGTNIYAQDEDEAKEIGAIILSVVADLSVKPNDLNVAVDSDLSDKEITTT